MVGEVLADEDVDDVDEDWEADGEWMVRATTGMALLCVSIIYVKLLCFASCSKWYSHYRG